MSTLQAYAYTITYNKYLFSEYPVSSSSPPVWTDNMNHISLSFVA